MISEKKMKNFHLVLLALGFLYFISSAFHQNVWFDESYSVSLIRHSFPDLIRIGAADVHPLLYYILLKLFCMPFGYHILAARLFSVLGSTALVLLGYTHIRKDYGPKTGIWFSILAILTPVTFHFSSEIRMYSWAAVFVMLTFLYACRLLRNSGEGVRLWILFALCSLLSAYTHYFGFGAVIVINALLFLALLCQKKRIKYWLCFGAAQIVAYLPGLYILFRQASSVSKGYWINIQYPDVLLDAISFYFIGDTPDSPVIWQLSDRLKICIYLFALIILLFGIVKVVLLLRNQEPNTFDALGGVLLWGLVIAGMLVVSLKSEIFHVRYTLVLMGPFFFFLSFGLARSKLPLQGVVFTLLLALSIVRAIPTYQNNYNPQNDALDKFLSEEVGEKDLIVSQDIYVGSIVAVKDQKNPQLFLLRYDHGRSGYDAQEAYEAYDPPMDIVRDLDSLSDYEGYIWAADNSLQDPQILKKLLELPGTRFTSVQKEVYIPYRHLYFVFSLIEKTK